MKIKHSIKATWGDIETVALPLQTLQIRQPVPSHPVREANRFPIPATHVRGLLSKLSDLFNCKVFSNNIDTAMTSLMVSPTSAKVIDAVEGVILVKFDWLRQDTSLRQDPVIPIIWDEMLIPSALVKQYKRLSCRLAVCLPIYAADITQLYAISSIITELIDIVDQSALPDRARAFYVHHVTTMLTNPRAYI